MHYLKNKTSLFTCASVHKIHYNLTVLWTCCVWSWSWLLPLLPAPTLASFLMALPPSLCFQPQTVRPPSWSLLPGGPASCHGPADAGEPPPSSSPPSSCGSLDRGSCLLLIIHTFLSYSFRLTHFCSYGCTSRSSMSQWMKREGLVLFPLFAILSLFLSPPI